MEEPQKQKKPIYKRFWFLGLLVLLVVGSLVPKDKRVDRLVNVGDTLEGGVVFVVESSKSDGVHGIVVSMEDVVTTADYDLVQQKSREYRGWGYNDWKVPSLDILKTLYNNRSNVRCGIGDSALLWSDYRLKTSSVTAWVLDFRDGKVVNTTNTPQRLRLVRSF